MRPPSDKTSAAALARALNRPITIQGKPLRNRLLLAPMAGLGHVAFRELVAEFGGFGLLFTGMCSARAVPHENPRISPVFRWRPAELSFLVCQIFGPDPDSMAAAARRIEAEGFFGVDLNFGCSVSAICKRGCGAALLRDPDLAARIVEKVRRTVSIPVFVKFRTGWEDNPERPAEMARRFEDAGADALVFHPRVAPDRRSRPPRMHHITRVRETVSIPVFGNGNLFDRSDCRDMLEKTGCEGLSIGRMAVARPWIFASLSSGLDPDEAVFRHTVLRLADLLEKHYDPIWSVKLLRKFLPYFCASFRFGHSIHKRLARHDAMETIRLEILEIFETTPQTVLRPNLHLFT